MCIHLVKYNLDIGGLSKIKMLVSCLNNDNTLAYGQTHELYIFQWEGILSRPGSIFFLYVVVR